MSEIGKYGKGIGVLHPSDVRRLPAMPDKATPGRHKKPEPKPFGISYRYSWRLSFFKQDSRPFHKWFKTRTARDQSLAHMRREKHGGEFFYRDLTEIDP